MPSYLYVCPRCGPYESQLSADALQCRCGKTAKRRWHVAVNKTSMRQEGRWDPVVGQYVENQRHFKSALEAARDLESERLNMEVKLEQVDPRDHSALAELHGQDINERIESVERTEFEKAL